MRVINASVIAVAQPIHKTLLKNISFFSKNLFRSKFMDINISDVPPSIKSDALLAT